MCEGRGRCHLEAQAWTWQNIFVAKDFRVNQVIRSELGNKLGNEGMISERTAVFSHESGHLRTFPAMAAELGSTN